MHKVLCVCGLVFLFAFSGSNKPSPYKFPSLNNFPPMPVSADNPVTVEGADLGRHLFYDPILSRDSSFSCSSCHKQEFAFSDSPNQFSKGSNGESMLRNTPGLFNLAWYKNYFWDGRAKTMEEQVVHPIRTRNELNISWDEALKRLNRSKFYGKKFKNAFGNTTVDSLQVTRAVAQFERTLLSYNSKFDKALRQKAKLTQDELEGFELVNDMTIAGCVHCHTTDADALGTTGDFNNTGLDDVKKPEDYKDKGLGGISGNPRDNGRFKTPSLRNLVFTGPYMHDGRFKTIEEVIDFYSEHVKPSVNIDSKMEFAQQGGARLDKHQKRKIIAFLKTMSDSSFVKESAFSNPFKKAVTKK